MKYSINIIAFLICALFVSNLSGQSSAPFHVFSYYDFHREAGKANWISTIYQKGGREKLKFGVDNKRPGSARLVKKRLEDNSVSLVLHTHPKWTSQGMIQGCFPYINNLPKATKLKGAIGFIKPHGSPKSDGARFLIYVRYYHPASRRYIKKEVFNSYKRYTGRMNKIEVDLSAYAGKKVSIILEVEAGKTPTEDWAAWDNLGLYSEYRHSYLFTD